MPEVRVAAENVDGTTSEGDKVPDIEVDLALSVEEELGEGNIFIKELVTVVLVLDLKSSDVIESTIDNSLLGLLVKLSV